MSRYSFYIPGHDPEPDGTPGFNWRVVHKGWWKPCGDKFMRISCQAADMDAIGEYWPMAWDIQPND